MNSLLISELPKHLFQSTVFVAAMALITFVLRGNKARIRYWAWFIASAKFLVPFALFTVAGNRIGWRSLPIHIPRYDWLANGAVQGISTIGDANVTIVGIPEPTHTVLLLFCVWALGTIVVLFGWFALWRRIKATLDSAIPVETGELVQSLRRLERVVGVRKPIRLAFSSAAFEPGVFGILHPVLLLPNGIVNELDSDHIEAVLLHELNHVHRRDNLIAFLQMAIQTIFWFHPVVWWVGSRLVVERERACDEEVLGLCSKPKVYAESILRICAYCNALPMHYVSSIGGGDLRRRIETIVSRRIGKRLNVFYKCLLVSLAVGTIGTPFIAGILSAQAARAEIADTASRPKFEIATIKPSDPQTRLSVLFAPGGRLVINHATVRFLIKIAYDVGDDQITGGPTWVNSKRFDVEAKPEVPFGGDPHNMTTDERRVFQEQVRLRLQSLLADRFKLVLHTQSKDVPIYALTLDKNGPRMELTLSPSVPNDIHGGRGEVVATSASMETLARFLGEQSGRPVIDMTGLKDNYKFQLEWTPDSGQTLGAPDATSNAAAVVDTTGTSLFTAVQQQLGLKLQARKAPADLLTIDSADVPLQN
jgi:bla regulator protein blaR1